MLIATMAMIEYKLPIIKKESIFRKLISLWYKGLIINQTSIYLTMSGLTEPIRAGEVRKGMVILLKGFPCTIIEMSVSKTGKLGYAKAHFVGIDIFTSKKYEDMSPTSHNMERVIISQSKYPVLNITDDDYLELMDENTSDTRGDIKLLEDDDESKKVRDVFTGENIVMVTILSAMGKDKISSVHVEK